ncbi:hypothetical protein Hanom_Chr03g00226581 [Helianthus anomalus]
MRVRNRFRTYSLLALSLQGFGNMFGCGARWCRFVTTSFRELLELYNKVGLKGGAKEAFEVIVKVSCWCIWRARNKLKFENKQVKTEDIIIDLKAIDSYGFVIDLNLGTLRGPSGVTL